MLPSDLAAQLGTELALEFAWDPAKAKANARKHGVTFEEAASVFGDRLALTLEDLDHSETEQRFVTFGQSLRQRLLVVAHTLPPPMARIISARAATNAERRIYEEE